MRVYPGISRQFRQVFSHHNHGWRWRSTTATPATSPPTPLPTTSTSQHTSLATFLEYAKQVNLSPTSTVYQGTYYEYLCLSSLSRLGFTLSRRGGANDAGVDLLGHWNIPGLPYPLKAIVQCKSLKNGLRPHVVRELEGAFIGASPGWRGDSVVGVLCALSKATKGVREAIKRAERPIVWVLIQGQGEEAGEEGLVKQVLWNERVTELGAQGLGVQVRYLLGEEGEVGTEAVLTWEGKVWEPEGKKQSFGE